MRKKFTMVVLVAACVASATAVTGPIDWAKKELKISPVADWTKPPAKEGGRVTVHYHHSPDPAWAAETPKGFLSGLENPTRRDYFMLALPHGASAEAAPKGRALVVILHGRNGGRFMDGSQTCIGGVDSDNCVFYAPPDAYALACDSLANLLSDIWYGSMPPPRTIYSDTVGNLAAAGGGLKNVGGHYGACDSKALGMKVIGGTGQHFWENSDCSHWGPNHYVGYMWGFMGGEQFDGPRKEPFRTYRSDPSMTCLKWNLSHENAVMKRILDEIEWVVRTYGIDRNRIYVTGNSMGGQAALALGLTHGEVFAAVNANVPATIWYAAARLGMVDEKGADVPAASFVQPAADPAPVFDWSGSDDAWSREHDVMYRNADRFRFAYVGWWGEYGHCGSVSDARKQNDLVCQGMRFFDIRRDQAYVVFTKSDSNDPLPWPEQACAASAGAVKVVNGVELKAGKLARREGSPSSGQWNGWLQGQVTVDTPERLEADVWIASEKEVPSAMFKRPAAAKADVSFRRLQRFAHAAGAKARWTAGSASGEVSLDDCGLFTLAQLPISAAKTHIVLETVK